MGKQYLFNKIMRGYRRIFATKWCYPLNRLLFNLSLRGLGIAMEGGGDFYHSGEYHFLRRLSREWRGHPVVFDVGAHQGVYSRAVKELAPQSVLYAFEPHPKSFGILEGVATELKFEVIQKGCSDSSHGAEIFDLADDDGSLVASMYKPVIEEFWNRPAITHGIEVVSLDDFVKSRNLPHIDLLKIDTEGHELQVLNGALDSINRNIVDVIQFEFNQMNIISRSFFRDFIELLPHYSFHRILPRTLIPLAQYRPALCEIFALQNIVAVRKGCGVHL